jgi:hypothetical protein
LGRYDSPGFVAPWFDGAGMNDHEQMTASGSMPDMAGAPQSAVPHPEPGGPSRVLVTSAYAGPYDAPVVDVRPTDTAVSAETGLYSGPQGDPFSGVPGALFGETGAGHGKVVTPDHPNALPLRIPRGHA